MENTNPYLVRHDQLPAWCHDNPAIIRGYRRVGGSSSLSRKAEANGHATARIDVKPAASSILKRTNGRGKRSREDDYHDEDFDTEEYEVGTFYKCWRSIWDYWHNETGQSAIGIKAHLFACRYRYRSKSLTTHPLCDISTPTLTAYTVNIHTHLWGAVISLSILVLHVLNRYSLFQDFFGAIKPLTHSSIFLPPVLKEFEPDALSSLSSIYSLNLVDPIIREPDWKDTLGFAIFLLSAVCCLGLSATFHTCVCHSQKVSKKLNQGDYIGIVILITGSFIPAVHYGFYCDPQWQMFYTCGISVLALGAAYTVIDPVYSTSAYRPLRTLVFVSLGLSAIFPVAHLTFSLGVSTLYRTMGLDYLVLSGALYIIGALVYANRIPEKFFIGKFDFIGASHQIFHIFILFAAFAHYVSLRRAFNFWHAVTLVGNSSEIVHNVRKSWLDGWFANSPVQDKVFEVSKEAICLALDKIRK